MPVLTCLCYMKTGLPLFISESMTSGLNHSPHLILYSFLTHLQVFVLVIFLFAFYWLYSPRCALHLHGLLILKLEVGTSYSPSPFSASFIISLLIMLIVFCLNIFRMFCFYFESHRFSLCMITAINFFPLCFLLLM